jgi:sialic acid synthase SpsE
MFGINDIIKSKADALKFAIIITAENVYQDGRTIPTMHLAEAKRVYELFDELNLPEYQKDALEDNYGYFLKEISKSLNKKED